MALPQFAAFELSLDGNIGPRWTKWLSRFDRLMVAMNISDFVRKQALLLHYAGPEIDEIYDTLPVDDSADESEINVYQTTANALTKYFTLKTNTAFEIYNFRQATQGSTETIDTFVTRLRKLAKSCNFADTDREVNNQIVFACHSQSLRRRALRDDLPLDKLIAAARALELSEVQATTVEGAKDRDRHVNAIRPSRGRQRQPPGRSQSHQRPVSTHQSTQSADRARKSSKSCNCNYCGYQLPHRSEGCPAKGQTCTACRKIEHFASVCRSSQQHTSHRVPQRASHHTSQHTSRANIVTTDCEPVEIQQDHYVFSNSSGSSSTILTCHVTLQGEPVEIIIDTGAFVNILQSSTYNSLQDRPTLQPTSTRIFPYGERSPLPVLGMANFNIGYNSERFLVTFHVVKGTAGNLLGYNAAEKIEDFVHGRTRHCHKGH